MTFIDKTFLSRNLFTENCTLKALRLCSFTVLFHFKVIFFKVIQNHFLQSSNRNNSPSLTRKLNRKWPKPKWIPYLLWRSNTRMPDSNFEKDSCRNSLVPWANFQLKRYECFFLKKCFVLSACYASSLHCFHLLKSKTTPMYSVLKWKSCLLHLCDDTPQTPAWLKLLPFSFALSRVACCMHALCMCYTFASMSKGCIVYHSFHELHILWRFKLILFLRLLLTVPWNTMYNKAILVFSVVR